MRGMPLSGNPDSPKNDGRYLLTVDEALKYRREYFKLVNENSLSTKLFS